MFERTCSEVECESKVLTRGLCSKHYQQARRNGSLPLLDQKVSLVKKHRLANIDREAGTADCSMCGPKVEIRVRATRAPECRARHELSKIKTPSRRNRYIQRYNLSVPARRKMEETQQGACLICGTKPERLVVDHCHKTGRVRGLLCNSCNLGIGFLRDNPATALAAASYLLER